MNAVIRHSEFISQAGSTRRRFTLDDVEAMEIAGVLEPDARVELIEGDLVDMPDDSPLHIDYSVVIGRWLHNALDESFALVPRSTSRLSRSSGPKPDWYVFDARIRTADLHGDEVLLAIEQSRTSLRFDLGDKAKVYSLYGVRDYWSIELETKRVHVHRDPTSDGYASVEVFEADRAVEALLIPGLTLRLADLPRVG